VDAGDPVDVDALADKFTLTIASAKSVDDEVLSLLEKGLGCSLA
jgi:hypothetical protein